LTKIQEITIVEIQIAPQRGALVKLKADKAEILCPQQNKQGFQRGDVHGQMG
jgi:hypothetical protein